MLDGIISLGDPIGVLAGIAWEPHIKGVLVVLTGVAVLMGSIYLILFTNMGARLGFLVAAGGLFGWLAILGLTWWISPPAIGPRGDLPVWEPVEIVVGDPAAAASETVQDLPNLCYSTASVGCASPDGSDTLANQVIADNPDLFAELDETSTLSEAEVVDTEGESLDGLDFGGWEVVSNADAGEAQSEASAVLVEDYEGFADPTEFKVLDTFELGGKDEREDDSMVGRVWHKITSTAQITHPEHFAVVQVQRVVPQTPEPGAPPPPAQVDESAPVVSVVMVRELGNRRVPPALFTVFAVIMLGVIAYALHRRDKLTEEHLAGASGDGGD